MQGLFAFGDQSSIIETPRKLLVNSNQKLIERFVSLNAKLSTSDNKRERPPRLNSNDEDLIRRERRRRKKFEKNERTVGR